MPRSVFADPTGRRWRTLRRTAFAGGIITTVFALAVVVYVLVPPTLPTLTLATLRSRTLTGAPTLLGTRAAREHAAARRKLFNISHDSLVV